MSNVLFLMVARGGSKGVPGKNLKQLGGLSLIGWKARSAKAAMRELDRGEVETRLIISTESPEIQAEALRHGVEVPFTRPAELATDEAKSVDVVRHALRAIDGDYDTVILLEPSAPFTTGFQIVEGYQTYCSRLAHLVVGMKRTEPHSSFIGEQKADGAINNVIVKMHGYSQDTRRQARKDEWTMAGNLYIFRSEVVLDNKYNWNGQWSIYNGGRNFGIMTDRWHGIEIDTPHDFEMAQYAVDKGYVAVPDEASIWSTLLGFATS